MHFGMKGCVKSYPKYGFVMDEKMQLQRLRHLIIIISSLEKKEDFGLRPCWVKFVRLEHELSGVPCVPHFYFLRRHSLPFFFRGT